MNLKSLKMKNFRTLLLLIVFVFSGAFASAQDADKILNKYVKAIGGKEKLSKMKSLYTESEADIMGMASLQKTTILNGKGYKMEMEIMGEVIINCLTEKGGWVINPMMGDYSAQDMPEAQYVESKSQMFIGGPFTVYLEEGYQAKALGNEAVGSVNANKVELTPPGGTPAVHFFDSETGYIIKTVMEAEMEGQMVKTVLLYSDYKEVDGISIPHKIEMDAGGMFQMTSITVKVEVNKEVDPAIFIQP
ncbi:MAG: hypothetical protein U9R49_09430 [Bacteroidota bacterium]|nr:hypothetical protein [Bacteroidota bacterium]